MSLFAIGDLHLPGQNDKPMDVFGNQWKNHFEVISMRWRERVTADDIVLIPGDISWAMHLSEAKDDLNEIAALPGRKVILRGNHDYWWSSIAKVRRALPDGMYALQNDALELDEYIFCGTRGWLYPTARIPLEQEDIKIYEREMIRLRMSLEEAARLTPGKKRVALFHFPPMLVGVERSQFAILLEQFHIPVAVYGHLHGVGIANGETGTHHGVTYHLVSCDALDFDLKQIFDDRTP